VQNLSCGCGESSGKDPAQEYWVYCLLRSSLRAYFFFFLRKTWPAEIFQNCEA
jgi:hypothetical protein